MRTLIRVPLLVLFAAGGTLAPVKFSPTAAEPAAAECTTCCSATASLCVVCSRKCMEIQDAYDAGTGACPP